ncbi:MAG: hypothetical protein K2O99_12295, partial [Lachnospiraceae bacterium]|nr:hypothetical protein [Lachnospiraceae bacterium]
MATLESTAESMRFVLVLSAVTASLIPMHFPSVLSAVLVILDYSSAKPMHFPLVLTAVLALTALTAVDAVKPIHFPLVLTCVVASSPLP